jgi:predicted glycosyltransferase
MKLLFYCQHVLGMGHFIRSAEIVRSLRDFDVTFLNGGVIVPGFDLPAAVEVVNLPAIQADEEFRDIHVADDERELEEIQRVRTERILAEYDRARPDVLIIELFPFGRLKFAFELIPLLERAKAGRTRVVCSLRDILVAKRKQQQFEERACRIVNQYFDLLLVHSDPRFQRLEETFPSATKIECPIRYTGFVTQTVVEDEAATNHLVDGMMAAGDEAKILVSIGGGRIGGELINCATDASALLTDVLPHRMLIFAGPYMPEEEFGRLQTKIAARPNVKLVQYTTRFLSHLKRADLSISMAGYNTCMNILAARARAIVYPFTGGGNWEQTLRAEKLQALGVLEVIHRDELDAARLAEKITLTINKPRPETPALDLGGAEKTATLLAELVAGGAR